MKKLCFFIMISLLFSCKDKAQNSGSLSPETQKELSEIREKMVNLSQGDTPKNFLAKTMDGKIFNSEDLKGKNWVIFVLNQSESDLSDSINIKGIEEFKNIYSKYKNNISYIGIWEGHYKDEAKFRQAMKNLNLPFALIDNTQSPIRNKQIYISTYCYPAKILIGSSGKVLSSSCGVGNNPSLHYKLDSINNLKPSR